MAQPRNVRGCLSGPDFFDEVLVDRREFLAATAVAAVSPLPKLETLAQSANRQYIELRRYHLLPGAKQRAFTAFVGDVAIPAMNRAGIGRIGAFTVVYGENAPSLLLVLAHQSLDSVVSLRDRLASATCLALSGLPAAICGLRRVQRRKHLLLSLGGTRLGGNRTRLRAAPGRLRLGQLHGHRFGIQRRSLAAGQRDQGTRLPDQRLQRAERVTGLL